MRNLGVRGTTLIELSVATFLFLIVLGLTSTALSSGVKNYLGLQSEIALQQDAIVVLAKLTREIGEANSSATWPPPAADTDLNPPAGNPYGIVLSSARNNQGKLLLDNTSRQPIWQKRICYIFDPTQEKLFRSEDPLAGPSDTPPGLDPVRTTQWFQDNMAQDPLPGQISEFRITTGSTTDQFTVDIKISNSSLSRKTTVQFLGHSTMRG